MPRHQATSKWSFCNTCCQSIPLTSLFYKPLPTQLIHCWWKEAWVIPWTVIYTSLNSVCCCRWAHTIHLYYLQLRHDVLKGQMFCHKEPALVLAAYALQADQGDYQSGNPDYFQPDRYVRESVSSAVPRCTTEGSLIRL